MDFKGKVQNKFKSRQQVCKKCENKYCEEARARTAAARHVRQRRRLAKRTRARHALSASFDRGHVAPRRAPPPRRVWLRPRPWRWRGVAVCGCVGVWVGGCVCVCVGVYVCTCVRV